MKALLEGSSINAYELLGCDLNATPEQIGREYRNLMLRVHPDKNPTTNQDYLLSLNRAYEILKDPASRKLYDSWVRSGLQIPFDDWQRLPGNNRLMHWSNEPRRKAVGATWVLSQPESSDRLLQQFREYKI